MTTTRQDLLQALAQVQNAISAPIDIMTITGFMSDDDVRVHLDRYVRRIQEETNDMIGKRPSRRRRAA